MESNEILALITAISAFANIAVVAFQSWRKLKPEVKKLEAEGDSEVVEAANTNLEGAKISQQMLKERVDDLRKEIEEVKQKRKEDADYFRRRLRDVEKEARDYRTWAARLSKQVIEAGKIPVPFISSLNDTDPLITAISREQEELGKAKDAREAELRKEEKK